MFSKKNCGRCGEKIKNSYEFCPNCGLMYNYTEVDITNRIEWLKKRIELTPLELDYIVFQIML